MPTDQDAIDAAVAMWDRYEQAGEQFAVFSTTNQTVRELNSAIQARRGRAGLVSGKKMMRARHHQVGVGDHVVARQNDRGLVTDRGHWVRNRDTFIVTNITKTSITATGSTGTVQLPADYVKDNLDLGYAQTSHAGQGRTVDHSLLVVAADDSPDRAGVYVPMTRGRTTNRAVVATGTTTPLDSEAVDRLTEALQRRWIDAPAIGEMADTAAGQQEMARASLDYVATMTDRNRNHARRRTHPLHVARRARLHRQHRELTAALEPAAKPFASDARAAALESIRRVRRQYNLPEPNQPDIGI